MRWGVIFGVVAGTALATAAQAQRDCSSARTQMDANICAQKGWESSDRELNRLWKLVKPAADRRGQGKALLDAQRAWLKYRDATCESERKQYEGGSIAPLIYWSCMDRLTLQRNQDLKELPTR